MHIDIFFIILFHLSNILFFYQVGLVILKIRDENINKELQKIFSHYDLFLGLGDIIIWPITLTIFFPVYVLVRLLIKRKLLSFIKLVVTDKAFIKKIIIAISIFLLLVIFALWHLYIAYAILFVPSLILLIIRYKKEKSLFEK